VSVYSALRNTTVEKKCDNSNCCEYRVVKDLSAFQELGATLLRKENDVYCRECGQEMVNVI
jgi:hypothetical protein